ncbi:type II toxin-antitoxin system PemK/MazF family toxin [Holdemania massiliensis]|uniref:type II toxin-antitoxin system PemK/MazF family toxin n=1 Tax=Holdemania massiliensis TaxID=1468449 RepID=UPI001F050AEE|nr:type II toxin-antitoxin system PemK/MazF family toxin [Holdemania massiliensis]MCH1941149.1 type II toxin-antitoxin system PemK/MazF family toxin [Holdemania massiliensis]
MDKFKQGDIIFMDFDPTKGHEQAGVRPALVVSNNDFGRIMGLYAVCPITNNTKNFPTHVPLSGTTKTSGSVLCEHFRTVDLEKRQATFRERCPEEILEDVLSIIHSCF